MMDNVTAMGNENFYATVYNVVYKLDSDADEEYSTDHGDNPIQVISVDPDMPVLDTSSEGSSGCNSPVNCCDSESEDNDPTLLISSGNNSPSVEEVEYCAEDVQKTNLITKEAPLNNECTRCSAVIQDALTAYDCSSNSSTQTNKSSSCELLHCNVTQEPNNSQSLSHDVELTELDFQSITPYKDLKDLSLSKVLNRNNKVPDMFDENVLHFPDNDSFDPIIDKEIQKILGCSLLSPLNEDKKDEPADSLINSFNRYGMLEKILNSSDVLFNSEMEDCDLGEDLDNFDLPRFIMGDSQDDLNELLKENSISSQLRKSERTMAEKKQQDSFVNEFDMSQLVNIVMSTPKKSVSPVMQIMKRDCDKMHKDDSEDIDIETISDGESFPIANNVEQFEAEEKLKSGEKIQPFKNYNNGHRDTAWSSLSKHPHCVKRSTSLNTSEKAHHASISKTLITPCASKSYQNTKTESAQLNQRISSSGDGDFEHSKSLPETRDIVLFYKQISSCRGRLGLGKGKNIAVRMEHRTDEFRENAETNSILVGPTKKPHNKTNSLLKVNDISSNICPSNLSDSNCSKSDHLSPVKSKSVLQLGKLNKTSKTIRVSAKQLPEKSKVTETIIDIACDKNVKKSVVVAINSDSERLPELKINNCERLSDSNKYGKTLCENVKVNIDSLTNKDKPVRPCVPNKDDVQSETSPTVILLPGEPKENSAEIGKKEPLKRKLNLEEYKKRREGKTSCETSSSPVTALCDKWICGKTLCENVKVNKDRLTKKDKPVRPCVPNKDDVQSETSPTVILLPGEPKENSAEIGKKEPLKRKLNLEEYKKRREGKTSCETSSSPVTALCDKWICGKTLCENVKVNKDSLTNKNKPVRPCVPIKDDVQPETSPTVILLPGEPKENSAEIGKKEPLKRKLNLEEYKKRREGKTSCETSSSPVTVLCDKWSFSTPNSPVSLTNRDLPPPKPEPTSPISNSKLAVTESTVAIQIKNDNLNNDETGTKLLGPIGKAYKKALQMKKLSAYRCNEDKLIQSKISEQENVVILPIVNVNGMLLPMIKKASDTPVEIPVVIPNRRKNSEYKEIVMVSIGVNTNSDLDLNPNIISEKLLTEREILTSERLNDSLTLDHGEDKIIIHLKKNTPKPETSSISVQTDSNMIIKDCAEDTVAEVVASPETELAASVKERLYGKRKQSSSSNSSLENGNSSKKRCDYDYKMSSRKTNSLNGQRCSPLHDQYSSHSPRRNTRINNDRGCHNEPSNHNASYNRRSPSISRDQRTHYVYEGSRNSSNSSTSSLSSSSTSSSRYGFVTYLEGEQAHRVAEKDNLDPTLKHRRAFCRDLYADLDDLVEEQQYYGRAVQRLPPPPRDGNNFGSLLEEMKRSMEAKRACQKGYIPRT